MCVGDSRAESEHSSQLRATTSSIPNHHSKLFKQFEYSTVFVNKKIKGNITVATVLVCVFGGTGKTTEVLWWGWQGPKFYPFCPNRRGKFVQCQPGSLSIISYGCPQQIVLAIHSVVRVWESVSGVSLRRPSWRGSWSCRIIGWVYDVVWVMLHLFCVLDWWIGFVDFLVSQGFKNERERE